MLEGVAYPKHFYACIFDRNIRGMKKTYLHILLMISLNGGGKMFNYKFGNATDSPDSVEKHYM